jgi:hypothetical protein
MLRSPAKLFIGLALAVIVLGAAIFLATRIYESAATQSAPQQNK